MARIWSTNTSITLALALMPFLVASLVAELPNPSMEIDPDRTALVITDPLYV